MAYSPAAEAGKKVNGKKWKVTIHGVPEQLAAVRAAVAARDAAATKTALRAIGALFRPHMDKNRDRINEIESVEWFEEEDPNDDFKAGKFEIWQGEFNGRLRELYDWADYNRVWIQPRRVFA